MKAKIILALCGLLIVACKPNKSVDAEALSVDTLAVADDLVFSLPVGADELFDDFLYNFMSARELQASRTDAALASQVQAFNSQLLFFLPQGYYTLIFSDDAQRTLPSDTTLTKATVEKIYLHDGLIQQYRFEKREHKWWLVELDEKGFAESRNASFLEFYNQFSSDEEFQIKSIANPLHFSGPNPDDDFENMDGIITAEQWPVFAPQLPRDVLYNIVYGEEYPDSDMRLFVICNVASEIGSELTFINKGRRWQLSKISM